MEKEKYVFGTGFAYDGEQVMTEIKEDEHKKNDFKENGTKKGKGVQDELDEEDSNDVEVAEADASESETKMSASGEGEYRCCHL